MGPPAERHRWGVLDPHLTGPYLPGPCRRPVPAAPSQPARPGLPAQPQQPVVEAPAPAPPQRVDHGLPVTTTDSMPGRTITHVIGDVVGVVARSREVGGNRGIQSRSLLNDRQEAVTRMCAMALQAGADAVVGMRYETGQVNPDLIEVVAYGTAVGFAESPGISGSAIDLPRPSTTASTIPPLHPPSSHTPPPGRSTPSGA